ncbi:MAG: hypothetical protein WC310_02595 [Patescibacteria group bacterium]
MPEELLAAVMSASVRIKWTETSLLSGGCRQRGIYQKDGVKLEVSLEIGHTSGKAAVSYFEFTIEGACKPEELKTMAELVLDIRSGAAIPGASWDKPQDGGPTYAELKEQLASQLTRNEQLTKTVTEKNEMICKLSQRASGLMQIVHRLLGVITIFREALERHTFVRPVAKNLETDLATTRAWLEQSFLEPVEQDDLAQIFAWSVFEQKTKK